MTNLVTQYIAIATERQSLADAIRAMNATLGTHYIHSRVREWERGDRLPSQQVIHYMLGIVLPVLLVRAGVSEAQAQAIRDACAIPLTQ